MAHKVIRDMMRGGPKVNVAEGRPLGDEIEAAGGGEAEYENMSSVEMLDQNVEWLQVLAQKVPEVGAIAARLEALRPKAEAADQGGGEVLGAPELEPAGPGPTGRLLEKLA